MYPGAIPGYFNSFHPLTPLGLGGTQAEARRGQKRSFESRLSRSLQ